jgi:hypothetical protein
VEDVTGGMPEPEGRNYDEIPDVTEDPVQEPANQMGELQQELAAIPEANTPSCKSKRRAASVDEHSLDHTEQIKAACNLDYA